MPLKLIIEKQLCGGACSLHGELRSGAGEDFVCDRDFLDSAPVVLVAPDVAPPHEEEHGDHGAGEAAEEGLATDDREEEVGEEGSCEAILEAAELVLGHPVFAVLQVNLSLRGDGSFIDEEVHEL